MHPPRPLAYTFDGFRLDPIEKVFLHGDQPVPLTPKAFETLLALVERHGRLVTKEELFRIVWPNAFVEENNLAQHISLLRRALGEGTGGRQLIETIPRRGYRFVGTVVELPHVEPNADKRRPEPPAAWATTPVRWLALAAIVLAVAGLAVYAGTLSGAAADAPRSLAVLPFRPLVAETRDEALEVGLAEAIIVRLGQVKQLRVPSIGAVQRYASTAIDPVAAGRELGVEAVLDGSLLHVNGNLRLSARLLDVDRGTTLWAQHWDLPWTDIFTAQDTLSAEVARALALSLAPEERTSLHTHPTNVAAYDRYLRARYLLTHMTDGNSRRAAELLEEAIRLDPGSAAAHSSLGFAYVLIPLLEGPVHPYVALAKRAAMRAIELDPSVAEAHAVLGRIAYQFEWDPVRGDQYARRALELNPDDPFVLHCYSLILADEGRFEESLALNARALSLDPASVVANRDRAAILYVARQFDDCVEQCRRTLELDPHASFVHSMLGNAYLNLHQPEHALDAFITPLTFSESNRERVTALRAAAERDGLRGFWQEHLRLLLEEAHVRSASVARAYVLVGDHEQALAWLERLYTERGAGLRGLKSNPVWDPLRADPRFQDLLHRSRVPQPPIPLAENGNDD